MPEIAAEILRLRTANKLTLLAFGKKVGVSDAYISQLEKGHRKTISYGFAAKVCAAFGLPLSHFAPFLAPGVTLPTSQPAKQSPAQMLAELKAEKPALPGKGVVNLPFAGWVGAGPGQDEPGRGETVQVPSEMAHGATCVYRPRGNSMRESDIKEGDYLVVRETQTPPNGKVVVVWIAERGMVVKELVIEGEQARYLHSREGEPTKGYPYLLRNTDHVYGVLVSLIRDYEGDDEEPRKKRKGKGRG